MRSIALILAVGAVALWCSAPAMASGFEIEEQDAKGLGTAYAGRAAAAENAAAIYWNPGSITKLKGGWVTFGLSVPIVTADLTDTGSTDVFGQAMQGESAKDGGGAEFIPHAYFTYQINEQWTTGIGFNVPFAFATDYGETWFGRYYASLSEVHVFNFMPVIAWAPNEQWSFGLTINLQYADATLETMLNLGAQGGAGGSQTSDGKSSVTGDSFAVGATLGAMFEWQPDQRVGLSYRSAVKHDLEGDVTFTPEIPGSLDNGGASAELNLPQKLTLSSYNRINEQWVIVGDISWIGWSDFEEIRIKFADGRPDSVTPADWDDTWRFAIGAILKVDEKWLFRVGYAYDMSPVPDSTRGPRIPDNDRHWLTLGTTYAASKQWDIDFGFLWLIASDATINLPGTGAETLQATSELGAIGLALTASYHW
jgi:long-chain fatty acid transport protein